MKRTRPDKLLIGLAVALALLGGVAWLKWRHIGRTHEVQAGLNRLLVLMEDIETGARGFAVTGESAFLEPFESGLKAVMEQQRKLEQLIHDAEQKANLSALEPLLADRRAFAQRNVELAALRPVASQPILSVGCKSMTLPETRSHKCPNKNSMKHK